MGACVQAMMHDIPNFPSPEGASFVYLQDKLSDLRGQYNLLAHKYNEMVRGLQECQNALHGSLEHIYELEKFNVKLQEQQKQTIHANQETNEQDQEANQAHAPLSMIAAWQRCSNKSLGQQCVQHTSQEGGGQNVICTQCLKSRLTSNIFPDPTNTEPEANHSFILPYSADEMPDLDKGQADSDFLMPFIPELGNTETLQPTDFSSCVSWPYQENIFPNALSEGLILHPRMFGSLNEWPVSCADFILGDHQIDDDLLPFLKGSSNACLLLDRVRSPCCKVSACDLTSNKSHSAAVPIKGCKSMEQQCRGQWRSFLSDEASRFCQCEPIMNEGYESFRENLASNHSTHLQGYLGDEASATLRSMLCDTIGQFALSFPTCISIRADCHNPTLNCLSYDQNAMEPSSDNKTCGHNHYDVSIQSKVHEHTKLVALAGNLACLAFPQGTYKTEMCNKWLLSMGEFCPYGHKCQFAHGSHELRPVLRHPRYKTNLCRMVAAGKPCPYGHRCHFRHVEYPREVDMFSLHSVREPTQF